MYSLKALLRERRMLSRLVNKRLTSDERNRIYQKWGIGLNSKKRRLQLVQRLWSNTEDIDHVSESAAIVAKLIKFSQQGQAIKEMFGLSFTPPRLSRRSFGWKNSTASLVWALQWIYIGRIHRRVVRLIIFTGTVICYWRIIQTLWYFLKIPY